MKNTLHFLIAFTILLYSTGCKQGNAKNKLLGGVPIGQESPEAQAAGSAAGKALGSTANKVVGKLSAFAPSPNGSLAPQMEQVDETFPCGMGGQQRIKGSYTFEDTATDPNSFSGNMSGAFDHTVDACKEEAEGAVFTLNGSGRLTFSGSFSGTFNPQTQEDTFTYSFSMTMKGTYSINDGTEDLVCAIDLSATETETGGSYSGTVCGEPVNGAI